MAWLTADEAKAAVAAALHAAGYSGLAAEGSFWSEIIPKAASTAQQDILSVLLGRGFTLSQINSWDGQADCHRQQTVYWALVEGQGLLGLDPTLVQLVDRLDRRKWLLDAALVSGSDVLDPDDDSDQGRVGYGSLNSSDSKFGRAEWDQ